MSATKTESGREGAGNGSRGSPTNLDSPPRSSSRSITAVAPAASISTPAQPNRRICNVTPRVGN